MRCIQAPHVDVDAGLEHLRGEWHLHPRRRGVVPGAPKGNVFEIQVAAGEDPVAALEVHGVHLDDVRHASGSLFPPC